MSVARVVLPLALAACAVACSQDSPVALVVIAPPDGGDPFLAPDAATAARITLEDDASAPVIVPVGPQGDFRIDVRPTNAQVTARLKIEALRDNRVIGAGATPPVAWQQRGGNIAAVFMQRCDTVVPARANFAAPRGGFTLIPVGSSAVAAVTVASGDPGAGSMGRPAEAYDFLVHTQQSFTQMVPPEFDGSTAVVTVSNAWVLVRGASTAVYTGNTMSAVARDVSQPPSDRPPLVDSVVLPTLTSGGGWVVGGRDAVTNMPSARVDHVADDARWDTPPAPLRRARSRPQFVLLRLPLATAPASWLLAGGQTEGALLEVYNAGSTNDSYELPIADRDPAVDLDGRTGVAMVCVTFDATGCSRVLLLGGRRRDGEPADDVLLDGACVRNRGAGCTLVTNRGTWTMRRRINARVAVAEGNRVLVVGGRDALDVNDAPVFEVEAIDVSTPDAPRPTGVVTRLTNADPAVLALPNGNVMIAGGTDVMGAPRPEIFFYRHCE